MAKAQLKEHEDPRPRFILHDQLAGRKLRCADKVLLEQRALAFVPLFGLPSKRGSNVRVYSVRHSLACSGTKRLSFAPQNYQSELETICGQNGRCSSAGNILLP